jgi:two-component system phosphate regulon sensor histidine kinase PhoR
MLEISATRQYIQGVATPLEKPAPGSVLLIFQNITHQRFLETVRRDFVSNISHELRTPLASLKALTETLLDSAIDDPQAARRFLKRMDAEVDALTQIVSELLQLSRVESGKVPFQMQSTKPDEIINPAVERLLLQADRAELSINLECPPGLPAILADPARLEQVVVNLLHNAIKFTPSGGEIRIKVRQQDDDHQDGGMVLFSISDTGIGIESEDLPRIFERFYKVDRARSSGGTGLGLAIARHTVEAHGGVIWAESVAKHGSTFYFTIPIAK